MDIIEDLTKTLYPDRSGRHFRIYWQESYTNENNMSRGGVMHAWMSTWDM